LYRTKFNSIKEINISKYKARNPRLGILILLISFSYPLGVIEMLGLNTLIIDLIFNNFLMPEIVLTVFTVYVVLFRKSVSPIYIKIIIFSMIIILALQTLSFSKSGLITLVNFVVVILLALRVNIRFSFKYALIGLILLALLLQASFSIYKISSQSLNYKGQLSDSFTLVEKYELYRNSQMIIDESSNKNYDFGPPFARAGYFDYSAEVIANSDQYIEVFTFENYIKSLIDSLTPGFDLFDQIDISSLLKYEYSDNLDLNEISPNSHHTDQFGFYGEFYNLFGYGGSLLAMYFIAWLLKASFSHKGRLSPFAIALKRVLILGIFYQFFTLVKDY